MLGAARSFLRDVPDIDPAHRRWYALAAYAIALGVVIHFGLAAMFAALGVTSLAVMDGACVLVFLGIARIHRQGRLRLAFVLSFLDVIASSGVSAVVLGWGAGFQNYVILPVVFNGVSTLTKPAKAAVALVGIAVYAGLYLWTRNHAPLEPLPQGAEQLLYVANAASTFASLLLITYVLDSAAHRLESALDGERRRADALLENILPAPIVERLKSDGGTIAESFGEASVMFCDIVGFTSYSEKVAPQALVTVLNELFSRFDDLAEKHGVEKIKTIGDAYMVAAGIPVGRGDHAHALAAMALEMPAIVRVVGARHGADLRMRIGIHSGPVVAGVIGKKKFIYDLWGDTVNTASRMESHGLAEEIQVTEATCRFLRDRYDLVERGTIDVKGKGPMQTFLLKGPRAA